jgi:mitochondrial import inner membrane translocase subunit TIM22
MRYDSPLATSSISQPGGKTLTDLPMRDQLRIGLKDMGSSAYSSAKNFGKIGAMYSVTECCIEGLRGKNDLTNGVAAGAVTGAVLARHGGPQAVAFGAVGFAVFSGAIDWYMRSGDNERRFPVI